MPGSYVVSGIKAPENGEEPGKEHLGSMGFQYLHRLLPKFGLKIFSYNYYERKKSFSHLTNLGFKFTYEKNLVLLAQ